MLALHCNPMNAFGSAPSKLSLLSYTFSVKPKFNIKEKRLKNKLQLISLHSTLTIISTPIY